MDPSQHDFVPPPAYSAQEEFDTKISTALAASLTITQPSVQQAGEEEWEQWDDAVFNAAANSTQATSSSDHRRESRTETSPTATHRALPPRPGATGPSVPPLKIHKKNRSSTDSTSKQRPSWYAEAGLDGHQAGGPVRPTSAAASGSSHAVPVRRDSDSEDYSVPPPPFTAVGPSLEGPPFEDMDPLGFRPNPPPSRPPSRAPSIPPSQFRPPLPLPNTQPVIRVSRAEPAVSSDTGAARLSFNPAVAYNKHKAAQAIPTDCHPPIQSFDAAALYNSSVASHLTIVPSQRPQ
ncbi:uncharacterized protein EV420DRAFT_462759 [Desarmillaria tabescens]|uniref:Uncharacterized protein n=1 Tax=Armillaria tabescens TaxID=1929756 RepID=A0AA39NMU0_ARMTA|nr:uncharacterized protein EV420DRAFT_462759 [Desarmillaria tabescens]KAK0468394.1 hypothetical protein EV420DRAFT_462759 [Desarmillaria tabescens]